MVKRPTLDDVAQAAGVSITTVDRAINGRARVRVETLQKIADAAHRVGYHNRSAFHGRLGARIPEIRLGLVLLKQSQEFYRNFAATFEQALKDRTDVRGELDVRFSTSQSPSEFASLLKDLGQTCQAVAAVAVNDPTLDPVVRDLTSGGTPVFSLLNDFGQGIRRSYLGLNNLKTGRLAAWLITRTARAPGKLAMVVGGNRWHGHDLRETGFRSFVREADTGFQVLDTMVNLETRQLTYEALLDLMDRHPDLRGIYVAGGGMEGAISALREVRQPGDVAFVVHELTRESRAALDDGYATMVLATPLKALCGDAIDMMIAGTATPDDGLCEQQFLEPRILLPETL